MVQSFLKQRSTWREDILTDEICHFNFNVGQGSVEGGWLIVFYGLF